MAKEKKINEMSLDELKSKLIDCKESLLNLRFQKSLQQLEHPQKIANIKKDLARINTFIRQHELKMK